MSNPIITLGKAYCNPLIFIGFIVLFGELATKIILGFYIEVNVVLLWKCLYCIVIILLSINILVNPGIAYTDIPTGNENNKKYCSVCQITDYSMTISHCDECICIKGRDHHCILMSKCVSKSNFLFFVLFVRMAFILYAFTLCLFIGMIYKKLTKG